MTRQERDHFQYLLDELCWWICTNCGGDANRILWMLRIRMELEDLVDGASPAPDQTAPTP